MRARQSQRLPRLPLVRRRRAARALLWNRALSRMQHTFRSCPCRGLRCCVTAPPSWLPPPVCWRPQTRASVGRMKRSPADSISWRMHRLHPPNYLGRLRSRFRSLQRRKSKRRASVGSQFSWHLRLRSLESEPVSSQWSGEQIARHLLPDSPSLEAYAEAHVNPVPPALRRAPIATARDDRVTTPKLLPCSRFPPVRSVETDKRALTTCLAHSLPLGCMTVALLRLGISTSGSLFRAAALLLA